MCRGRRGAGLERAVEGMEDCCAGLAQRGQFLRASGLETWPDGTVTERYAWQHAVYQEAIYARGPEGRRLRLHRRIGAREEAGYGAQASAHAAELAMHFERGQDPARAVRYLQQAADTALQRYACQEASASLQRGLALRPAQPETPARAQQELALQLALGQALMTTQGFAAPAVAAAYARARDLCRQLGPAVPLFPVLYGQWRLAMNRPEFQTAEALSQQLLDLAQRQHDPRLVLEAYLARGQTCFRRGELATAHAALAHGLALFPPHQPQAPAVLYGRDARVECRCYAAWILWLQGYADQAVQELDAVLRLARGLTDPYSLVQVRLRGAVLHQWRGAAPAAQVWAEETMALCTAHGVPQWLAGATIKRGWALVRQGQREEGLGQMRQGLAAHQASGSELALPYFLAMLAEACGRVGQVAEGVHVLAEALTVVQQWGGYWWQAELYRLQGALRLAQADPGQRPTDPSAASRPRRWSCAPPRASPASGSSRASTPKPTSCWRRSMAGSPKAGTPRTSKRPKRSWRRLGRGRPRDRGGTPRVVSSC